MRQFLVFALAFVVSLTISGFVSADYDEGIEYKLLPKAQPAPTDGKVEVIEFFSYGCPHCYRFEPYIEKWMESKPDNVEFISIPAVFSANWEALASLYYAAEVLGVQEKMHPIIFEAMHGSSANKARSLDDLKAVFEANGISGEKLEQALSSFTVAAKTRRAKNMTKAYDIQSVPNVVVQGKYMTNGTLAESHDNVFKVVDFLVEKITTEAKK